MTLGIFILCAHKVRLVKGSEKSGVVGASFGELLPASVYSEQVPSSFEPRNDPVSVPVPSVGALLEENARLKKLVIQLSELVIKRTMG